MELASMANAVAAIRILPGFAPSRTNNASVAVNASVAMLGFFGERG
jgi:hypothetical protein